MIRVTRTLEATDVRGDPMDYSVRWAGEAREERSERDWGSLTWLASAEVGNATGMTLGRVVIRPGKSNPMHSHANCEEALYLLRGRLRHSVSGEEFVTEAGDTLVVAAGAPHRALNVGAEDAEMIVAYSAGERDFTVEQ